MENIKKGTKVLYNNLVCEVAEILNFREFKIKLPDKTFQAANIKDLNKIEGIGSIDLDSVKEKDWVEAKRRLEIIRSLVKLDKRTEKDVKQVAKKYKVGQASIYRWIKRFQNSDGLLSSLLPSERSGGKGLSRITDETDQLINEVIHKYFLTNQKRSISQTYIEIIRICKNKKFDEPSLGTVRNRINALTEKLRVEKRHGKQAASNKFDPKVNSFPGADYPLSTVQIDHTKLDIIVIDKHHKTPIGRPWLTLAIDIYSRMVVGYYLGFEAPSILNTGICISNSMAGKESILQKFDVDSDWPCWGKMQTIHTDNGKDFRSIAIKRACEQYDINLEFRPLGKPHFGGHIERLLGTFVAELHAVPGTTFEDIKKRKNYNSAKKAILTLQDLEKWLLIFMTKIYHLRIHKSIGTSPLMKYKEGLLGTDHVQGIGIPEKIADEKKMYIDFLPAFDRTVQDYGVVIDHVFYYSDVLRPYINATERPYLNATRQVKKTFTFRRDPRDISKIHFFDPNLKCYFEIPYRNINHPTISIWELKAAIRKLKVKKEDIDETKIFEAYNSLREIEKKAEKHKRTANKQEDVSLPTESTLEKSLRSEEETTFSKINFNNIKTLKIDD